MEILPITIEQTILLLIAKLTDEEKSFIKNSTYNELLEFEMIKDLDINHLTGLSDGNIALLEDCSNFVNSVTLISIDDAIKILVEKLIFIL